MSAHYRLVAFLASLQVAAFALFALFNADCRVMIVEKLLDALAVGMLVVCWRLLLSPVQLTPKAAVQVISHELKGAVVGGFALGLILSAVFLLAA